MRKSITEQNRLFFLAIAAFIAGVALIWLYFVSGSARLEAGGEILLTDQENRHNINAHMAYLPDEEGRLTLEDIQSPAYANRFKPALGQTAFGLSAKTYWIRAAFANYSTQENWMLRLSNPVVDSFDVYVEPAAAVEEGETATRSRIADHYWTYSIRLPADLPVTVYMRAATDGSMIVPLELIDERAFRVQLRDEYLYFGLYYGFVLLMFAYMLAMYIFIRTVSYLYYSLYLIWFALSQLIWNGLLQEILGEDHWLLELLLRAFDNYEGVFLFSFIVCLLFGLLFLDKMLQLAAYAPRMELIVRILGLLSPLILGGLLFHWPGFSTMAIYYETVVVFVLTWATCLSVYRGNRAARYIVLALISLLGLAIPAILYTFGLMEFNILTHYGYQIGSVAEFVILAFAVSYQLRQNQIDKEAAQEQMILHQERMVRTLEHWNEELEQTVSLRTEKLVRIQQERNELLQNISHDIRTPLTVVQGGIRAMLLGIQVEPGEKNKHLEKIYEKVLYMNRFIDELFQLSRFEHASATEALESVRVRGWLEKEFLALAHDIRLTGRSCECLLPADDQSVMEIDCHAVRRALSNLVDNACKYSSPDSKVTLNAVLGSEKVQISVRDEGEGIAPEYLERIFERSDRGGKTGGSSDGNGLGLAIVKEIVERHHGEVRVESERGKGSCFCFTLPVAAG
ncbi:ATP-binding protein [Cohnella boryungensis]|uniref:histidine kinase n=1 Tax=Cohnella boryungensis TaxID=768479 RepID=A0ABV8S637_9BACL